MDKNLVLKKVFEVLKQEENLAKVTGAGSLEDGYLVIKDQLGEVTEEEYRDAINTIKENDGVVEVYSDKDMELTDEELEKVSGGALEFEGGESTYEGGKITKKSMF